MSSTAIFASETDLDQKRSFADQVARLFGGQLVFFLGQWLLLLAVTKVGGPIEGGLYTLALAISAPIFLFFDLNLRVIRSTDHQHDLSFKNYVGVRFWTLVLSSLMFLGIAAFLHPNMLLLFVGMNCYRLGESISNLAYGQFQRSQKADLVGRTLGRKGVITIVVGLITVFVTHGSAVAVVGVTAMISLLWSVLLDLPTAWAMSEGSSFCYSDLVNTLSYQNLKFTMITRALPMGVDALLTSLAFNIPRYILESEFGLAALGSFGLLTQLAFSIQMLLGTIGHTGVSVLAEHLSKGDSAKFYQLLNHMLAASLVVGGLAVVFGTILLPMALTATINSSFDQPWVVFWLLTASCIAGLQRTLGRGVQAANSFFTYMMFDLIVMLSTAIAAWFLIPQYAANGASSSMTIGFAIGLLATVVHLYCILPRISMHKNTTSVTGKAT